MRTRTLRRWTMLVVLVFATVAGSAEQARACLGWMFGGGGCGPCGYRGYYRGMYRGGWSSSYYGGGYYGGAGYCRPVCNPCNPCDPCSNCGIGYGGGPCANCGISPYPPADNKQPTPAESTYKKAGSQKPVEDEGFRSRKPDPDNPEEPAPGPLDDKFKKPKSAEVNAWKKPVQITHAAAPLRFDAKHTTRTDIRARRISGSSHFGSARIARRDHSNWQPVRRTPATTIAGRQ